MWSIAHDTSRVRRKDRYAQPVVWGSFGLGLCLLLSACVTFGPRHVPEDRFNYNEAIGRSANAQMLLNLVRMRYRDVPVFLAVSGVLTQYVYTGRVGAGGAGGASTGAPLWSMGGDASVRYIERPTITYNPMTGEEFSQQLLKPVPAQTLFALIQSGWPVNQLISMGFERLNNVENIRPLPTRGQEHKHQSFQQVAKLIIELAKRKAIELQRDADKPAGPRYLVFEATPDPETQNFVDELKDLLGLDRKITAFRVTRQLINREPDEITVRMRSLLGMMGYLSHGIQIPDEHIKEKRAEDLGSLAESGEAMPKIPLHVLSSKEPPETAFIAVEYQDYWFYIPHNDHESKQAFGLLTYLYQLQAPQAPTAGPLLTVPTG